MVHSQQHIADLQTGLPNGLDDETPPPLSKGFVHREAAAGGAGAERW